MIKIKRQLHRFYIGFIYAILWGMVWIYPVLVELITAMQGNTVFSWANIRHAWTGILPFFLLFLFHRIPVYRLLLLHRVRAYCFSAFFLLLLFVACRYLGLEKPPRPHPEEKHCVVSDNQQPPGPAPEPFFNEDRRPAVPKKGPESAEYRPPRQGRHHFAFFGIPGLVTIDLIIAILMLGFDIAIILLSRYQEEEEKKQRLDAAHKEHELEHLKAQINPHFFMNMLNNIHGMVEIDSRLAQDMIMELSRLMRYVLYEGAKPYTTLQHEKEFIDNYVELMRKRCSDTKVCIGAHLPQEPLDHIQIPPLLFICIIENAFKHGISYRFPSFVEIRLSIHEDRVTLECMNSVHPQPARRDRTEGGIGLANLRQRLELLYGKSFSLEIDHTESVYHVILTIPFQYETDTMPCH